jgi:CheY-like chemotaxis protein
MAKVLLIEDDESNRDFILQILRLDQHETQWAADGQQGIALMRQSRPDLIICDVIMPHLGGYAVLETVRADPQLSGVPMLLYSAAMNREGREIGMHRGATEILAKPFNVEQLRAAVGRCLGEGKGKG